MMIIRTGVLIFLAVVTAFFSSSGQEKYVPDSEKLVTLHMDNVALTAVLDSIQQQTQVEYSDLDDFICAAKKVSVHVDSTSINDVLKILSQHQIFNLHVASGIMASIKPALVDSLRTGYVVDKKGNPVPHVTVAYKKIALAVVTTKRGSFYFNNVIPGATLEVYGFGVKHKKYKVGYEKVIRIPVEKVAMTVEEWWKKKINY